jgi:hypothetical protein
MNKDRVVQIDNRFISRRYIAAMLSVFVLLLAGCSKSDVSEDMTDVLPGYAKLTGTVTGSEPGVLPVVFANNTEKDVAYTVFVIDGKYRAVNLIPGPYEITIRAAVDQLEGFTPQTVSMNLAAGAHVASDFALENVGPITNYIGGTDYSDAEIVPYDELYPPGPGRDIIERTCHGCHQPNFFSYNMPRAYSGGRVDKDKTACRLSGGRGRPRCLILRSYRQRIVTSSWTIWQITLVSAPKPGSYS